MAAPNGGGQGRDAVGQHRRDLKPGGPGLRLIRLAGGYNPPLQVLAGIFARKGERHLYDHTHPLNLLWNAFAERAPSGKR
jgi:hypothetical protein